MARDRLEIDLQTLSFNENPFVAVFIGELIEDIKVTKQLAGHPLAWPRKDLEQPARTRVIVLQRIDVEPLAHKIRAVLSQETAQDTFFIERLQEGQVAEKMKSMLGHYRPREDECGVTRCVVQQAFADG
jgi:hypothetical protein